MRNKKFTRALALLLGTISCFATLGACNKNATGNEIPVALPDYADDREVQLLGYANPTNGDYKFDGIPTNDGVDFRTVERFKEYKDAGLNVAFARYDSSLPAETTKETWKDTGTKVVCDKAYEAGIKKILISDEYFSQMISGWDSGMLVGDGPNYRYQTQAEMDADVAERLEIYKDTPGFYGVILLDEPRWKNLPNYGTVHSSLARVAPDMYLYNNLHYCHKTESSINIYVDETKWQPEDNGVPKVQQAYENYLDTFFKGTGAKNCAIDIYPFEPKAETRLGIYFANAQVLQRKCEEYGAEMSFTGQSITYISGGTFSGRIVKKNDLWLQMNTMLGFGATSFQYYTYFPYPSTGSSDTSIGSFIDRNGNRTSVYYDAKSVNEAVLAFDHILLNYKFKGAKFYFNKVLQNASLDKYLGLDNILPFDNSHEHKLLSGITQGNDAVLTTELYDSANDLYMYMVMNPMDILYSKDGTMQNTENEFTAEFPGYDYVAEFDCGRLNYVKLDNGKYTKTLSSGYAVYLVPLKA